MKSIRLAALLGTVGFCGLTSVTNVQAQPPKDPVEEAQKIESTAPYRYNGIYETPWYANPTLRRDLKLSNRQYESLTDQYRDHWDRFKTQENVASKEETAAQRQLRVNQMSSRFYEDLSRSADDVIADPVVKRRFNQLQWQYRQYGAFHDPYVQQRLNLTEEQLTKLAADNRRWNSTMDNLYQSYSNNSSDVLRKFNQSRSEYQENLKTVLTPQQRQTWSDLIGPPYDFPPEAYFETRKPVEVAKPALR